MANMKSVNKIIKAKYPHLEIEAVRGDCYVYFVFGVHTVDSLYVNPVTTNTDTLAELAIDQINDFLIENDLIV